MVPRRKILTWEVTAISGATRSKYSLVPTDNFTWEAFVKVQPSVSGMADIDTGEYLFREMFNN